MTETLTTQDVGVDQQPTAQWTDIFPADAVDWLANYNKHNRLVSERQVQKLTQAMVDGAFRVNGDTVVFAWRHDDWSLLDGQHRLLACVRSGKPFRALVVWGVDPDSQETIDIGRPRNLADMLALRGEGNAAALAITLGYTDRIRRKAYTDHAPAPAYQLLRLLEEEPQIREWALFGRRVVDKKIPMGAGMAGALAYQFALIDADDAVDFFSKLSSGAGLPPQHPILMLRNRLFENKQNSQKKLTRLHVHALTVKSWNFYREGRTVTQLKWVRGGSKPESFPEPI